ncbi:MAG: aspartyl/asparaginyl beta-hydroxylase domain-containing protein [Woeseiaceae bacterium]|nr:aspartyl/asparaginyl beta-hydroxylase domain-containing protein [Woeseiaceae bacterium]
MDIGTDQRCLGPVDTEPLRDRVLGQAPEAWTEQAVRQQLYEVHRDTESIVMLFCDEEWPDGEIYRESGWNRLADVATPVIDGIIDTYYEPGGIVLRAMAAKLKAGGRINPHRDKLHSFHIGHRVHVPLTTNNAVRFTIGGKPYAFDVGNAYEINNQKVHSVMNLGRDDRITFIFDYVPPDRVPESVHTGKSAQ